MEYFNKFCSTVTQVAAQVSNALPGNPLMREYEIGDQICVAGPGFYWKIFKGVKKSTKKVVSIWLLDKKDIDRWPKDDRELFLTLIKHGVSQLTRLRHPRLLVIEHPVEESRDSLAFASELVFACLASCLIRRDHLSLHYNTYINNFVFSEVERKHGLLQLGEALAFLHIDAGILHRNVTPESVVVNDRGAWKLAGFEFSVTGKSVSPGRFVYESFTWSDRTPTVSQPNLDYLAPEYVVGDGCSSFSDIYSLGILSYAVYNEGRPPLEHKSDLHVFKKNIQKLNNFHIPVGFIPPLFLDDLKMCLKFLQNLRPDASQYTKIAYFNDPLVKTLSFFESLVQLENSRKIQFFKSLPTVLVKYEKRVLLQKVLPYLCSEFTTPDIIPFILPSIFLIIEATTKEDFSNEILPQIIPVFSIEKPYQIALLLLQKMELLLERASEEHVRRFILPLVYNAINSETIRIQELCLSIVPNIGKLVDRNLMKTELLPKLLELAISGSVLAVRVQSLVCIGKLLPTLESWMVTDLILPALPKVKSKEPGVLMAILGIYKLIADCESIVVSRDQWAKSVLPFLLPICVENTLNLGQFEQFMSFIKFLIGIVENEQRFRLQQHCAGQEQQMNVGNFDDLIRANSVVADIDIGDYFDRNNTAEPTIRDNIENSLPTYKKNQVAEKQQSDNGSLYHSVKQPSLSSLSWCSKVPSTCTNRTIGSNVLGDVSVPPGSQNAVNPHSQKSDLISDLDNLDLSVFENPAPLYSTKSSGDSLMSLSTAAKLPAAELGTVDGDPYKDPILEGLSFSAGIPLPPRSTNTAVQRKNKSVERPDSIDSLLPLGSINYELAVKNGNNTFLDGKSCVNSTETLNPLADFLM